MPRDGSGQFQLVAGNPVVPDTLIETGWANPTLEDIAQQITNSIAADGQTTPSGNLPMGGFVHTGVGDPTLRNQYTSLGMVQDGRHLRITVVSGVNNLVGSLPGGQTYPTLGQTGVLVPQVSNTGPVTLSINGGSVASVLTSFGNELQAGDIEAGAIYTMVFNGSAWYIQTTVGATDSLFDLDASVTGNIRPDSGTYPSITVVNGTTVAIPPGSGSIVPPGPEGIDGTIRISWEAQNVIIANPTGSFTTALAIDANKVIHQYAGRVPDSALRSQVIIGVAIHLAGVVTGAVTLPSIYGDDGYYQLDIGAALTNQLVSGGRVTANSGAPLALDIADGRILRRGGSSNNENLPNYIQIPATTTLSMTPLAGSGTLGTPTTNVPVLNYDPNGAGVVTPIPGAAAVTVVHRLYYIHGTFVLAYGQYTYATFENAMSLLEQDRARYRISPKMTDAVLVAEIVASKGTTDLSVATDAAVLSRGTVFYGIGSAGSIADAPSDGNTYGRNTGTWQTTIAASTPNMTGDPTVTKTDPTLVLVDTPTGSVGQGIDAFRGAFRWFSILGDQTDDALYIRSHNPSDGVLRYTWEFDLGTGNLNVPAEVVAPAASLTDGTTGRLMPVGSFGLGAEGQAAAQVDLDLVTRSGFYWADTSTLNSPSGANDWAIQHLLAGAAATEAVQFAVSMVDGAQFRRIKVANVWTSWTSAGGGGGGGSMKVQIFTASGVWTRPPGVDAIEVIAVAGGQGGSGVKATNAGQYAMGGGGGGGHVIKTWLPVTADVTVTVGAGGAGGVGSTIVDIQGSVVGSPGGDTTLSGGTSLTVKGGGAYNTSGGSTVDPQQSAGGGGGSGDVRVPMAYGGGTGVGNGPLMQMPVPQQRGTPGHFTGFSASSLGGAGLYGYGGGGCGAPRNINVAYGGRDGGGAGAGGTGQPSASGGNGIPNTGGGGGGAYAVGISAANPQNGGTGGSGIVLIRWWE